MSRSGEGPNNSPQLYLAENGGTKATQRNNLYSSVKVDELINFNVLLKTEEIKILREGHAIILINQRLPTTLLHHCKMFAISKSLVCILSKKLRDIIELM